MKSKEKKYRREGRREGRRKEGDSERGREGDTMEEKRKKI